MRFKLIIAGGRDFSDFDLLEREVYKVINDVLLIVLDSGLCIVSGGAKGADALGEEYAKQWDLPLEVFPADWKKYGRSAGPIRNEQMAENADALIAFWDGRSSGTAHMIKVAKAKGLAVRVINY